MTEVKIRSKSGEIPKYETSGSAGMDLKAYLDEPVVLAPGKRALIQFQNTRDGYKGIGAFMYQECANRFLKDYDWVSLGEDMGVPGIRTYKSRLAPHEWIPRFEYRYVGR